VRKQGAIVIQVVVKRVLDEVSSQYLLELEPVFELVASQRSHPMA
jgi:hypothetical protein